MTNDDSNINEKAKKTNFPEQVVNKLFFSLDESEMIVIKAHLFVEYMLDKFIEAKSKSNYNIDKMNFTFYHKLNVSKILGLFEKHKEMEIYFQDLNKLRNQIAHKHTYDSDLYDKIVEYPKLYEGGQKKWKTKESFKIGMMIIHTTWWCGTIQAKIDYKDQKS